MSHQAQDFSLFRSGEVIPQALTDSKTFRSCFTYTDTQGTSSSWLTTCFVENLIFGTCNINKDANSFKTSKFSLKNPRSRVVIVSFLHGISFYNKTWVKYLGVESSFQGDENLSFFDLSTAEAPVDKLFKPVIAALKSSALPCTLILDHPELYFLTNQCSINEFMSQISYINSLANVLVSTFADANLIDLNETDSSTITHRQTEFLTKLYHRSQGILSLRPLETGRADDVTGTMTVSKGSISFEDEAKNLEINEQQYLYLVNKEGSVKVFFR
ncbi:hypothetical protein LJB42_003592 [Komagataella kurtzmanii]|nr:hypothetical protein LJB42_003592 [Komagataella kurtzmanii]